MNLPEVQAILAKLNIRPTKQRGQNFLIDEDYLDVMLKSAEVSAQDLVLEVGPGLGVLTRKLATTAKEVVCVELDKKLIDYVQSDILPAHKNVTLLEGDALSSAIFHEFVELLATKTMPELKIDKSDESYRDILQSLDKTYKVVANLPYQISSRALRTFFTALPRPSQVVVMVQKEVAERMTALAGEMSLLALATQTVSTATIEAIVPKAAYFPVPQVDSAIVRCDLTKPNASFDALSEEEQQVFWKLARAGFAAKRKLLKKNLSSLKSFSKINWEEELVGLGLSATVRAQELSVDQWVHLVKKSLSS